MRHCPFFVFQINHFAQYFPDDEEIAEMQMEYFSAVKLLSKLGRKQEALVEMKKAIEGYEPMVATSNIENATVKDRLETNYKLIEQSDKKLFL